MFDVVLDVAEEEVLFGNSGYVEYVSGSWLTGEKSRELKNLAGKIMTDPISDMLNRIRNAQAVFQPKASIPFSKLKYKIAEILEKEGFIEKVEKRGRRAKRDFEITLKYPPTISGLRRISKPGQRIYARSKELKPVRGGYGIAIISTPKGLMTNKKARKQKLGGEILCQIW